MWGIFEPLLQARVKCEAMRSVFEANQVFISKDFGRLSSSKASSNDHFHPLFPTAVRLAGLHFSLPFSFAIVTATLS
jgi:hypothetical protein